MKWYSVKEKLPPLDKRVLLCREVKITSDYIIPVCEIGKLREDDRFHLEGQRGSILPLTPTVNSGIITYWAALPKCPKPIEK